MSVTTGSGLHLPPHTRWGWFVGLGVLQVILGALAWVDVVWVTIAGVIFVGAMLLVGGIFQIVHAVMARGWSSVLLELLTGALYVVGGLLIMDEPVQGSFVITLFVAAALVVAGIMRIVMALRHREVGGWWLVLLGGLVTAAVGLLLLFTLPWSGLWVVGTLIAVNLLVHGIASIQFGLALRRWGHHAHG